MKLLLLVNKGERSFDKHGNMNVEAIEDSTGEIEKTLPAEEASPTEDAGLRYLGFKRNAHHHDEKTSTKHPAQSGSFASRRS